MADGSAVPPRSQRDAYYRPTNLHLRNLLTSGSHSGVDQQRALDVLNQEEMSDRSTEVSTMGSDRRRRDYETHLQDSDISPIAESLPTTTTSPPPFVRSRIRASRPSQRSQRHRPAYHSQSTRSDLLVDHSGDHLHAMPASVTPSAFTDNATDEFLTEPQSNRDQRYRAKRRKLDDGTFNDESKIARYGDKGRVTAGPLRLEIVSCDGGEYVEPPTGQAQHVLRDDHSVYSTKSHVCNMLLKHVGGMPFSLTKIVFKAPADGYDAPLQEGMIFVAMKDDRLLERAAQYDVQYSSKSSSQRHRQRQHDSWRPSQEYLQAGQSPLRPRHRPRASVNPYGHHSWHRFVGIDSSPDTALVPGFEVTFADPSDAEDEAPIASRLFSRRRDTITGPSQRLYTDRYRPDYADDPSNVELSGTSDDSEDEDQSFRSDPTQGIRGLDETIPRQRHLSNRVYMAHERSDQDWLASHQSLRDSPDPRMELYRLVQSRRLIPSNMDVRRDEHRPDESSESMDSGTSNSSRWVDAASRSAAASSSNRLAPHARFSIHRNKSAIAVNFDPAVAGRYILIKLWAPCPKTNIDIQSIIAHGYGGPRFFPSCEMR